MTRDTILVLAILAVTIGLFVSERLRLDLVAVLALLALSVSGILTPTEALAGFGNPLVIMIAALFVVAAGMVRTGLAERFGVLLGRLTGTGRARATAVVMLGSGLISAFVSTTGTVALMLPVTTSLARRAGLSPSLLLLPMAVGALVGGLLTLISTPPNMIVSDQLTAAGLAPFGLLDFTPVGLVMLAGGTIALVLFGGRLLPARAPTDRPTGAEAVARVSGEDITRGYVVGQIARLRVTAASPLVGASPADLGLRRRSRVNVVAIRRPRLGSARRERMPRTADEPLRAHDEIDVQGSEAAIDRLREEQRLELVRVGTEPDAVLAEVLLTPRSRLIGQTLADVRFRSRYRVNVLSVLRRGAPVEEELATTPLQFADTLLVAGSPMRIEELRREQGDFVVVAEAQPEGPRGGLSRRELSALAILLGMMALLALELVPAFAAVLLAAVALVLTRCVDMPTAYREINWESVVLIAAILPMATALEKTGAMALVVARLEPVGEAGPLAMLVALFALTGLMGQFISNTATAALVAPVALGAATQLGVSPYPFLMAVAVASSTAFATPVSTPVIMLVVGPGGYRFSDTLRVGLPLQLLFGALTVLVVPLLFPFRPA